MNRHLLSVQDLSRLKPENLTIKERMDIAAKAYTEALKRQEGTIAREEQENRIASSIMRLEGVIAKDLKDVIQKAFFVVAFGTAIVKEWKAAKGLRFWKRFGIAKRAFNQLSDCVEDVFKSNDT